MFLSAFAIYLKKKNHRFSFLFFFFLSDLLFSTIISLSLLIASTNSIKPAVDHVLYSLFSLFSFLQNEHKKREVVQVLTNRMLLFRLYLSLLTAILPTKNNNILSYINAPTLPYILSFIFSKCDASIDSNSCKKTSGKKKGEITLVYQPYQLTIVTCITFFFSLFYFSFDFRILTLYIYIYD